MGIINRWKGASHDTSMSDFFIKKLPLDASAREDMRLKHIDYSLTKAMKEATKWHLSLRCERGDHGCRNDGTSCLCRCHDVKML